MYKIYPIDFSKDPIIFDKHFGSAPAIDKQKFDNRVILNTFGSHPFIYRAGQSNYNTFILSTVFVKNPKQELKDLEDMISCGVELVVEDGLGEKIIADIQIVNQQQDKLASQGYKEYIVVEIEVVEIDDYA